jgi:predicted RNase H-like HicB family nuclease
LNFIEASMNSKTIVVRAFWDEEANVWVAESDDVDGLATEADTLDALRDKLLVMVPELLAANNAPSDLPEIPLFILAEQHARIANPNYR